jgi:hypothetical protein
MQWIKFEGQKLENHSSYIVSDGIFVDKAYYDCGDFYCYDMFGKITYYMEFPKPPKE